MRMTRTVLSVLALVVLGTGLLAAAPDGQTRPAKVKVTAEQANLREKPDIGSAVVQQVPEGTVLEADRKEGEWYLVRYVLEDGGALGGWIHESLVAALAPEAGDRAIGPERTTSAPAKRPSRGVRVGRLRMPDLRTGDFPLEFSVSGGLGSAGPGHLNDAARGFVAWTAAENGVAAPAAPAVLRLAYLVGFELSYRFSPRLALGLGADYMRGAERDRTAFEDPAFTADLVTRPAARAVPVKLLARYYPGAGFYVRGALGVYAAKASYLYRTELAGAGGTSQMKGEATGSGFGGEAALGGEWKVGRRTVLFAEAGFRLARFDGLTGTNAVTDTTGAVTSEAGTLYYVHRAASDGRDYALLYVSSGAPAGVVDARPAVIDLSGTAARAGVRFRF